ncbi:MAG: thiol-disulfide oxidoreductase [Bacteroidetes bacterium HGW-Bacteroidetes-17]|jgi:predicted DCC family thiol-disulfide oxidoreductase YuxK|nr:MAG: thiol-disulfide oxidoreductase [Bacteroidetes bacterium HGW-Bacteroidetes-17]
MNDTIVYFDDYCYLCSNTIQLLNWLDKGDKLMFIGLSNGISEQIPKDLLTIDSIIVFHNGQYSVKSGAIFHIIECLGGFLKIFFIFKIIPNKQLDQLYDLIARSRYRMFGKRKSCYVPKKHK